MLDFRGGARASWACVQRHSVFIALVGRVGGQLSISVDKDSNVQLDVKLH